jgi:serine/threonine-protein kinase
VKRRYVVAGELGRGGMGSVYLARALESGDKVAIKILSPDVAGDTESRRFLKEIQLTAGFDHPNILSLLDTGDMDGIPFHVTPYISGGSLRVIHRDIKPENILLDDDAAVVADLGLAKAIDAGEGERLTHSGVVLGTAEYMSPEQAIDSPNVDERCDVYALGCVLYEMLVGEPPFTGATPRDIMAKHLKQKPHSVRLVRPDVPDWVEKAILRALEKKHKHRFGSVRAFADALRMETPARGWLLTVIIALIAVVMLLLVMKVLAPGAWI